jgi:SM-20-related protein
VACATRVDEIAAAFAAHEYWIGADVFDAPLVARLRSRLLDCLRDGELARAGIGRGATRHVDSTVRGDSIRWLDGGDTAERTLFAELERLRVSLNETLYLGLLDVEAHYAVYPPGAGYRRHVDTFLDSSRRAVSFVLYLNERWSEADAGELVLYRGARSLQSSGERELVRIAPAAGTFAVFEADVPHEVLPAARTRLSIAGWFRRRG